MCHWYRNIAAMFKVALMFKLAQPTNLSKACVAEQCPASPSDCSTDAADRQQTSSAGGGNIEINALEGLADTAREGRGQGQTQHHLGLGIKLQGDVVRVDATLLVLLGAGQHLVQG